MIIKLGELSIVPMNMEEPVKTTDYSDGHILAHFQKTANELRKIAPKAKDFLYFTAIMMHAAEAAILDDNGTIRKDANGNDVSVKWDVDEKTGSWKWNCTDPNIKPYKNSNADIFPESELKLAYKKWVEKPLCIDHQSSSADHVRGLIIDTYYDDKLKRVIALCALDKLTYPDLARKVSTGYSTSVSMGTAVGRAICTDCGQVAKVESDFCNHMRAKSCYGEINVDLSPIELSIVVNGADPKAKIRHIVAAANSIAKYVDAREERLKGLKSKANSEELLKIKEDLVKTQEKIEALVKEEKELEKEEKEDSNAVSDNNAAYGQGGSLHMKETEIENPHHYAPIDRFASKDLKEMLTNFQERIEKLISTAEQKANLEDSMTTKKAYFMGGGGVNEPAPKQVKYEKEDSDKIRDTEDRQMLQTANMGAVDGLFPGDKEKKAELLRMAAEREARRLKREAALTKAKENSEKRKEAYFLGGGGVNEPTPGKPKYEKEDSDKIRDKEDKQMVGQSPFPGVGKVDGLHPSPESADEKDELKRKEKLSRAGEKLSGKFVKMANLDGSLNTGGSHWNIYAGDKLILTASVAEITGGRADSLYHGVANPDFGRKMISTIRNKGFDNAVSLFKGAQAVPAVAQPGTQPAAPPDAGGAAAVPAMPEMPDMGGMEEELNLDAPAQDEGGEGTPKEQVSAKITELDNVIADLKKAVEALTEEDTTDLDDLNVPKTAGVPLRDMRKTLNGALRKGIKEVVAELSEARNEMRLIDSVYANNNVNKNNSEFVSGMVSEAFAESNSIIRKSRKLREAFVKYARGTETLVKRAHAAAMTKRASGKDDMKHALDRLVEEDELRFNDLKDKRDADRLMAGFDSDGDLDELELLEDDEDFSDEMSVEDTSLAGSWDMTGAARSGKPINYSGWEPTSAPTRKLPERRRGTVTVPRPVDPGKPNRPVKKYQPTRSNRPTTSPDLNDALDVTLEPNGKVTATSTDGTLKDLGLDLDKKAARIALRAKLAQKGLKFSDMLDKSPTAGGVTLKDMKAEGDLAKVEDLKGVHDKMMDVATAPVKVRKTAADIQRLVVAGKIDPKNDFKALIAEGLDADAVKYWKQFYGEAKDGGSQFATELVKEYQAKKTANENEAYKVKLARAYELATDMVSAGLATNVKTAVDDVMKYNDDAFESMKKVVSRGVRKTASAIPVVGHYDSMPNTVVVVPSESKDSDLVKQFERAFSSKKVF